MNRKDAPALSSGLIISFISLVCISLELFLTRILNLKTMNHVVYVIIPFAILGYGVGANIYLVLEKRARLWDIRKVVAGCLAVLAASMVGGVALIIRMPISVSFFERLFQGVSGGLALVAAYLVVMTPFIFIGFLNMVLFARHPQDSARLYFWNLAGSAAGAVAFFFLINIFGVVPSVALLAGISMAAAVWTLRPRLILAVVLAAGVFSIPALVPEPANYVSDSKGWENFPRYFRKHQFETWSQRWHPLGRTDVYRLVLPRLQNSLYRWATGTFGINLKPFPDYVYLSTNFLGGTPVYHLSEEGLRKRGSQPALFSLDMEFPYLLVKDPKVLVIGAGGGRDVYFAKTHGAVEVVGAEINPEIYRLMSRGGPLHEYSGRIYEQPGVKIHNVDGRNLVKRLEKGSFDLIVLNGVDTFSGLSSGAYIYSESYLYTVNAVRDYLRVLKDDGMINFNRWIFLDQPRETLRLMVIVFEAMKAEGIERPWEHVMVGAYEGWGMMLVKKSPITPREMAVIRAYFADHSTVDVFPSRALQSGDIASINSFDRCAAAYTQGRQKEFIRDYVFDITPVTDDFPFFYKYYRLKDFNIFHMDIYSNIGGGFLVFFIQGLVLVHALVFILLFIIGPLWAFKREGLRIFSAKTGVMFVAYFAALGVGFMFIEIPLMQRFGLLLGSPIYSLSVTLSALLLAAGIGSFLLPTLQKRFPPAAVVGTAGLCLLAVMTLVLLTGEPFTAFFIPFPLAVRILAVSVLLLPLGMCLGIFFPSGLQLLAGKNPGVMAWAWGINCGFSVLGSMLAIMIAQFQGFTMVIVIGLGVYAIAVLTFRKLSQALKV